MNQKLLVFGILLMLTFLSMEAFCQHNNTSNPKNDTLTDLMYKLKQSISNHDSIVDQNIQQINHLVKIQDYKNAKAILKEGISLSGSGTGWKFTLVNTQERLPKIFDIYEKDLLRDTTNCDVLFALAYISGLQNHSERERYYLEKYEQFITLELRDPEVDHMWGGYYFGIGEYDKAKIYYLKALKNNYPVEEAILDFYKF